MTKEEEQEKEFSMTAAVRGHDRPCSRRRGWQPVLRAATHVLHGSAAFHAFHRVRGTPPLRVSLGRTHVRGLSKLRV